MNTIYIYADGGCKGNNAHGERNGWMQMCVLHNGKPVKFHMGKTFSHFFISPNKMVTNQTSELDALEYAIRYVDALDVRCKREGKEVPHVEIRMDSKYAVSISNGEYKAKVNNTQASAVRNHIERSRKYAQINIMWVTREMLENAMALARKADEVCNA